MFFNKWAARRRSFFVRPCHPQSVLLMAKLQFRAAPSENKKAEVGTLLLWEAKVCAKIKSPLKFELRTTHDLKDAPKWTHNQQSTSVVSLGSDITLVKRCPTQSVHHAPRCITSFNQGAKAVAGLRSAGKSVRAALPPSFLL